MDSTKDKKLAIFNSKIIESNESVVNNSSATIELMFEQYSSSFKESIDFGKSLFNPMKICQYEEKLLIDIDRKYFLIGQNIVEVFSNDSHSNKCEMEVASFHYLTNVSFKKEGELEVIVYDTLPKLHKLSICELTVKSEKYGCADTGINPFILNLDSGNIEFKDIDNLQFFEYDLDHDSKNELYIISFVSCMSHIRIYKVSI